jgi:integrase
VPKLGTYRATVLQPRTRGSRSRRLRHANGPSDISKHFKRLLTVAGLPAIRIHDLRQSCATLLLAQGWMRERSDSLAREGRCQS